MSLLIPEHKTPSRIPVLISIVAVLQLALLGSSLLQWRVLAHRFSKSQAYMQTQTGDIYPLKPIDSRRTNPEVIQAFTIRALMLLFNWPGSQPNAYGHIEPDKGVVVDIDNSGTVRVPSHVAVASFLVTPGFQEAMLKRISEVVPKTYFNGSIEVLLILDEVTLPKATNIPGQYEIIVVGNRYVVRESKLPGKRVPFNKVITLQEATTSLLPVGETPIERKVYGVRQAGFLIVDIRDISSKEN